MSDDKKALRAALYARFSTSSQRDESLDDQWADCEEVAAREGFTVVAKFGDKAISGGTAERPGYQAMLTAAREHKFEVIVVEDVSRMWRNRAEFGPRSAELEDLKVDLVTAVGDDTRRDGWGLVIQFKQAMAEAERKAASIRTRRGLKGLARDGKPAGGRSYGYCPGVDADGNKTRVIDEAQAKVVKEIFEWRAAGWSAASICRELNARGVPAPGANWKRTSTEPNRKNPTGDWLPSAIAGDPRRGVGILNNDLYRGRQVWGRSRWPVSAANSKKRSVEQVDETKWVVRQIPELRIVSDELWNKVEAIQTAKNPRREAVKQGIAKRKLSDHARPFWLSSILVCECGSNYIAYGNKDYCCPVFSARGRCSNDLRFRRTDVETELLALLKEHLLSDTSIEQGTALVEEWLTEQARQEEEAFRQGEMSAEIRRLDEEAVALRAMALRPAAIAAGLAAIERERAELLALAKGNRGAAGNRARRLLSRLPEIVAEYVAQVEVGIKPMTDLKLVEEARQATRDLLVDGHIVLTPSPDRTRVVGDVRWVDLGEHVLTLAGLARHRRAGSPPNLVISEGSNTPPLPTNPRSILTTW